MAHRSTLAEHRETWGSTETDPPGQAVGTVDLLIAHHFYRPDVPADASVEEERAAMRQVEHYHTEGEQEWDDIGYQFVVFDSGRPYEGRGWSHSGAHTVGQNRTSFAIAFAINGNEREPTEAAWKAARALVREGIEHGYVTRDYEIAGHRDYANKPCPGHKVYPLLDAKLGPKTLHGEEDDMPSLEEIERVVRGVLAEDSTEEIIRSAVTKALNLWPGTSGFLLREGETGAVVAGHAIWLSSENAEFSYWWTDLDGGNRTEGDQTLIFSPRGKRAFAVEPPSKKEPLLHVRVESGGPVTVQTFHKAY